MAKKLLTENELENVSGGNEMMDVMICCPLCNQLVNRKDASNGSKTERCITTYYYKCPNCKGEFHS